MCRVQYGSISDCIHTNTQIYTLCSYFEKGCWIKHMRQPQNYVLWVVLSSLFFKEISERMAGEAMDICLRALKESNENRFDSYSVRNSVLSISHNTFRDCPMHIFSDNLSRNSCYTSTYYTVIWFADILTQKLHKI